MSRMIWCLVALAFTITSGTVTGMAKDELPVNESIEALSDEEQQGVICQILMYRSRRGVLLSVEERTILQRDCVSFGAELDLPTMIDAPGSSVFGFGSGGATVEDYQRYVEALSLLLSGGIIMIVPAGDGEAESQAPENREESPEPPN